MKIIHVCTVGLTATKLLRPQSEYLRKQGHQVGFVFSPGPEAEPLRRSGFSVEEIPISRRIALSDVLAVLRMARYFRRERPDIVHTHTAKAGVVGRLAARLAGVPNVVHTIHGFPFIEGQPHHVYQFYARVEYWVARLTDLLLSQSVEDIQTAEHLGIRARMGYPQYLGNGVDTQLFQPDRYSAEQKLAKRRELRLTDVPILTIIARKTAEKGYFELVEALNEIREIDWIALFVGPDDGDEGKIRAAVSSKGLDSRVRFLGARDDIPELMAVTDVYVLPSYREGVPRSVIEAQSMGLPAVVTDIRGCREVVLHERTGLVVPVGDSQVLASAIKTLLTDTALRRQMGEVARQRVQEKFDERRVFERLCLAYQLLTEKKCTPQQI